MIKIEDKTTVIQAIRFAQESALQSQSEIIKEIDKISQGSITALSWKNLNDADGEILPRISDFAEFSNNTAQILALDCIADGEIRGELLIYQSIQSQLQFMKAWKFFMEVLQGN